MRKLTLLVPALLLIGCQPASPAADVPQGTQAVIVTWEVTEEAPGEYDQPNFSLALSVSGAVQDEIELGSYIGSFADGQDSPVVQADDAILTGASWWAGAGDEFYVRQNSDTLEVMHRLVQEESESGEFTVLKSIDLPENAAVEALQ